MVPTSLASALGFKFRVLGFRVLGYRVLGFRIIGFWVTGFSGVGEQEWNEMHHLKIMESLGGDGLWIDRFIAQHAAFFYYWVGHPGGSREGAWGPGGLGIGG